MRFRQLTPRLPNGLGTPRPIRGDGETHRHMSLRGRDREPE